MTIETLSLKGAIQVLKNDEVVFEKDNLIVQVGKNFLASAVISSSSSPFVAMAVGTGTTAAALGDTALQSEIARAAFTSSSVSTNVVSLSNTYAAGTATGAITEAGIFNNSTSGGTMLSHVVFSAVNKGTADTLTINWTITVG
jgi:hypothetical protein